MTTLASVPLRISVFALAVGMVTSASAQEVATFTNDAGDGRWETPGNWSNNQVPNESIDVTIPAGQAVTISTRGQ